MKRISIILFGLLAMIQLFGQSKVILSCDFEDGTTSCDYTASNYQLYSSLLNATSFWNTCTKPANLLETNNNNLRTSPDYFNYSCVGDDRIFSFDVDVRKFPTGSEVQNNFGGMIATPHWKEAFMFDFDGGLSNGDWVYYELSFKAAFSDTMKWLNPTPNYPEGDPAYNPKLKEHPFKVSFSEWGENWRTNSNNNELWFDISNDFVIGENAHSGWHDISVKFKIHPSIDATRLKHLIIESDLDSSAISSYFDYLFIDDVVLTQIDACESLCKNDKSSDSIEFKNLLRNSFLYETFDVFPVDDNTTVYNYYNGVRTELYLMMTNAMSYDVSIYDMWGGKQYGYSSKDVNILEDDDAFTDDTTVFRWWGTSQDGTPLYGAGNYNTYLLTVQAKNCLHVENLSTVISFQHLTTTHNFTDIRPENFVDTLENCCQDFLTVDNHTYTTDVREVRNNYIHAALVDPVTVSSGSYVQYNAGNEIIVGPDFKVEPGGKFSAQIRDCELNHFQQWKKSPESGSFISSEIEESKLIQDLDNLGSPLVYPNPTKGRINVYNPNKRQEAVILDLYGRKVKTVYLENGINNLNLVDLSKGTYTLKMKKHVQKIIKY